MSRRRLPPPPPAPAPQAASQGEPEAGAEPDDWLGVPSWVWYGLLAGEAVLGLYWLDLI